MSSSQPQRTRRSRKDRINVLREKVASFEEEAECAKQREKSLEDEKEQLRDFNQQLIHRLNFETNKRLPFQQTFQVRNFGEFLHSLQRLNL